MHWKYDKDEKPWCALFFNIVSAIRLSAKNKKIIPADFENIEKLIYQFYEFKN